MRIIILLTIFIFSCPVIQAQTSRPAYQDNGGKPAKEEPVMTKVDDTYIVNTTTLCDVRGFKGQTPLLVTFQKKNILRVEALPNMETPRFFQRVVKEMLPQYEKLEASKADAVDCITGATMSSNAVKANIEAARKYYEENQTKKKGKK